MNAAKIAAILNGSVQKYVKGIGGPLLTSEDVALAVSLISNEGARLLGRVKYAQQSEHFNTLVFRLYVEVITIAGREHWPVPKVTESDELYNVCRLAVLESTKPRTCRECGGRGFVMVMPGRPRRKRGRPRQKEVPELLRVECPRCEGQGILAWRNFTRVRHSGLKCWRWDKVWARRYKDRILPIVDKYEWLFWRGLRHKLRD